MVQPQQQMSMTLPNQVHTASNIYPRTLYTQLLLCTGKDISLNINQFEYESHVTYLISTETDNKEELHTESDYKYNSKHNYSCSPTISRADSYSITLNDLYRNDNKNNNMINVIENDGIKSAEFCNDIKALNISMDNALNVGNISIINLCDSNNNYKSSVNPTTPINVNVNENKSDEYFDISNVVIIINHKC